MTDPTCPHCGTAIGEHEATRCLDKWVYEAVLCANLLTDAQKETLRYLRVVKFSYDISAAWEVVEHILKQPTNRGVDVENAVTQGGAWGCHIYTKADGIICPSKVVLAPTAPLAICRAAVLAATGENT